MKHLRTYAAEFLGTFLLTLSVSVSIVAPTTIPTPAIAGLTLMILVYVLGPVSGAHVNPAVTVGLWAVHKIKSAQALGYIVAQCLGAAAVAPILTALGVTNAHLAANGGIGIGIAEAFGAAFLVMGVSSVVYGKTNDSAAGLTIGGSLFLGASAASMVSNGIVNPAVAIGLGSVSLTYLVAPLVGGFLAAEGYRWLVKGK